MASSMNVADAKKHLSELMSRVAYNHERFLIERRGKPMMALASVEDLAKLEEQSQPTRGLLASVGALADFAELDEMIEHIYRQREQARDRDVTLEE